MVRFRNTENVFILCLISFRTVLNDIICNFLTMNLLVFNKIQITFTIIQFGSVRFWYYVYMNVCTNLNGRIISDHIIFVYKIIKIIVKPKMVVIS